MRLSGTELMLSPSNFGKFLTEETAKSANVVRSPHYVLQPGHSSLRMLQT
jgi:hypothetical protein